MWRQWCDETFGEARDRDLAILVVATAADCPNSAAALPALDAAAGRISERYLCIRVTREEHPELDRRYRGAGWPSLVELDADQNVVRDVPLTELTGQEAKGHAGDATASDRYEATIDAALDSLVETADPAWGGWGKRQKFPHPDALHLLLVRWSRTGRDDLLDVVLRTLRSAERQPIHDTVEGGFYRYATEADWSAPEYDKPLLSNAKRMLAYAEAHQALGHTSFRDTALGVAAWMRSTLFLAEHGAFGGSQDADASYARLGSMEERRRADAPPIDTTIHADRNAWAAIALFKAGRVFNDPELTRTGSGVLQFLVERLFDPKRGVSHYWNGTWNQPGDLRDQATVLRAIVEGVHYAGANQHLAAAEAIATWTLEHLDAGDGSFLRDPYARPEPIDGRPAEDLRWNAMMGEALLRLGVLTRDARWTQRGTQALEAYLGAWRQHGFAAAGYARALDLLEQGPIHAIVVGAPDDDRTQALVQAALRPYVASRVVQTLDPAVDGAQLKRLGFGGSSGPKLPTDPTAWVEQGGRTYVITTDAGRLPALLAGSERC